MRTGWTGTLALLASLLTACGGGSEGSSSEPPASSKVLLAGVFSQVSPRADVVVQLVDVTGQHAQATTGSDGSFSIDVTMLTGPFLLEASTSDGTYFSAAAQGAATANVNAFTTQAVQGYYAALGTTANQVAVSTMVAANVPDMAAIGALTILVANDLQAYLVSAGLSQTAVFDPFIASASAGTGFAQVLGHTALDSSGLNITVDNGTTAAAATSTTTVGLAPKPSSTNPDLVQVTVLQNSTLAVTEMVDLCRTHGTKISGTGLYDCVASFEASPTTVQLGYNGKVSFQESAWGSSNLTPSLLAKDSDGNFTVTRKSQLAISDSNPSAVTLTDTVLADNTSEHWPTVAGADVGSSVVTVTDQLTHASIAIPVDVIVPVLLSIPANGSPIRLGGSTQSQTLYFTDGTNPVSILGGPHDGIDFPYDLSSSDSSVASVSLAYSDWYGTDVDAGKDGPATISFSGDFGSAGTQGGSVQVCVGASGGCSGIPTSLTVTAPVASIAPGASLQLAASEVDTGGTAVATGTLAWSSDNLGVSVDPNGLVAAASTASGSVTITVTDAANKLVGTVTLQVTSNAFPMSGVLTGSATLNFTSSGSVLAVGYTPPASITLNFTAKVGLDGTVTVTSGSVTGYTYAPFADGIQPLSSDAYCAPGTQTYLTTSFMECTAPAQLSAVTQSVGWVNIVTSSQSQTSICIVTFQLSKDGSGDVTVSSYEGTHWIGVEGAAQCSFSPFATFASGYTQDDYTATSFSIQWSAQ